MKRTYSEKPSAVRMRRKREKDKQRQWEQLGLMKLEDVPKVITWHCGCGAAIAVYDAGAVQLDDWVTHRRACLFTRAAFPVVLERAQLPAAAEEPAPLAPGLAAAGGKP